MRVKGLTITTAENNFIHARRRVQEKLGKNKTGNAPPPPTPAVRRGGSRPGPGEWRARRRRPLLALLALAPGKRRRTLLIILVYESAPQAKSASLLPTLMALLLASTRG